VAQDYGIPEGVLSGYLAQVYLRRQLNQVHGWLYAPKSRKPTTRKPHLTVGDIEARFDMSFAGPAYEFLPSDPPASDILNARLRAKYWGAHVLMYRPFVRQVLTLSHNLATGEDHPLYDGRTYPVDIPVLNPKARNIADMDSSVMWYAQQGIRAMMESTRAFHELKDKRFIVTNIFGTARAYACPVSSPPVTCSMLTT
jgi:hypothetical protein